MSDVAARVFSALAEMPSADRVSRPATGETAAAPSAGEGFDAALEAAATQKVGTARGPAPHSLRAATPAPVSQAITALAAISFPDDPNEAPPADVDDGVAAGGAAPHSVGAGGADAGTIGVAAPGKSGRQAAPATRASAAVEPASAAPELRLRDLAQTQRFAAETTPGAGPVPGAPVVGVAVSRPLPEAMSAASPFKLMGTAIHGAPEEAWLGSRLGTGSGERVIEGDPGLLPDDGETSVAAAVSTDAGETAGADRRPPIEPVGVPLAPAVTPGATIDAALAPPAAETNEDGLAEPAEAERREPLLPASPEIETPVETRPDATPAPALVPPVQANVLQAAPAGSSGGDASAAVDIVAAIVTDAPSSPMAGRSGPAPDFAAASPRAATPEVAARPDTARDFLPPTGVLESDAAASSAADEAAPAVIEARARGPAGAVENAAARADSAAGPPSGGAEALAVPVRGETAAPAATSPGSAPAAGVSGTAAEGAARMVAQTIALASDSGRVELRLDPPELGRVAIDLALSDGGVTASVSAERPETLDMLRRHADLLQRELAQAGFGRADIGFSDGQRGAHGQSERGQPFAFEPEREEPGSGFAPAPRAAIRLDRLDIRL